MYLCENNICIFMCVIMCSPPGIVAAFVSASKRSEEPNRNQTNGNSR